MAKGETVNVEFDENQATIPAFAMEATQAQMLKAVEALVKSNDEAAKKYKTLVEKTTEANKDRQANKKDTDDYRDDQLELLRDIRDKDSGFSKLMSGLGTAGSGIFKGLVAATGIASAGILGLAGAVKAGMTTFGELESDFLKTGVGFDDASGSLLDLVAESQRLGMSLKETRELLSGAAGAIQSTGKATFSALQTEFAQLTKSGAQFGMSMAESAEYLAEDLESRQALGILENVNSARQAARTQELLDSQLRATAILGKSIDDIRDAGKNALEDNAQAQLRMQAFAASLTPDVAADFMAGLKEMQGEMAATGVSSALTDQITRSIFDINAFYSEGGQQLLAGLQTIGASGAEVAEDIKMMQEAIAAGDPAAAQQLFKEFPERLMAMADSLSADELERFIYTLEGLDGDMPQELALSLGNLRLAADRTAKGIGEEFPALAQAQAAFTNSINSLRGSVNSIFTEAMSGLSGPIGAFADAMGDVTEDGKVKSMGITTAFRTAVEEIIGAFDVLGAPLDDTAEGAGDLATKIREFLVPNILKVGKSIADWIRNLDVDKFFANIKDTAVGLWDAMVGLKDGIVAFSDWFTNTMLEWGVLKPKTSEVTETNAEGETVTRTVTENVFAEDWKTNLMEGMLSSIPWGTIAEGVIKGVLGLATVSVAAKAAAGYAFKTLFGGVTQTVMGETVKSKGLFSNAMGSMAELFKNDLAETSQRWKTAGQRLTGSLDEIADTTIPNSSKKITKATDGLFNNIKGAGSKFGGLSGMLGRFAGVAGAAYTAFQSGQAIGDWMNEKWDLSGKLADFALDLFGPEIPDLTTPTEEPPTPAQRSVRDIRRGSQQETQFTTTATAPAPTKPELVEEPPKEEKQVTTGPGEETKLEDATTHQLLERLERQLKLIAERVE